MGCILWEAKLYLSTDAEQWVRKMKNMFQIYPGWPLDYPEVVLQFLRSFCSVTFPFSMIINLSIYLDSPRTQTTLFYSFPVLLPNTFTDETRIQSHPLHFSSISHLLSKYGWRYNYSIAHPTEGNILKRWIFGLNSGKIWMYVLKCSQDSGSSSNEWSWKAHFPQASECPLGHQSQTVDMELLYIQ